jgi:hypothetical protein
MARTVSTLLSIVALCTLASCNSGGASNNNPPNILFVIMDDVGIDQMKSFGYGGVSGPDLPNIDTVAQAGVRFRNTWSMPECSPGRAAFFLGQYPLRTNIYQAIGQNDLANSQISPFATTSAKLLKQANYESAMFGKFHLAGPENNEAGINTPRQLGWDYFYGWIGGLPASIDTTAGGVAAKGTYTCGFVPRAGVGSDGACYQPGGSCTNLSLSTDAHDPPGLQCLTRGGIFVPGQTCTAPAPALDFSQPQNAYYVSPLVIIDGDNTEEVPLSDPRARGYRTTIETNAAIRWINSRSGSHPWMATVSYSAAHTPWQQPPSSLLPGRTLPNLDSLDCTDSVDGRIIQDKMTEAMDTEFGRLLVETGLATKDENGNLVYNPKASNTVIVIAGDNGTLGSAVKFKGNFSPTQAKGTAYQTGVWVPLIVAGPQVEQTGRKVEQMVNTVDLYQLFAEVAGIDAHGSVKDTLDSVGVLTYLTNTGQSSLRTINFTQGGVNLQANNGRNGPCVINDSSCTQIPINKGVCEDNGGVWWGAGRDDPSVLTSLEPADGYTMCWQVNQARDTNGDAIYDILPEQSIAIRNDTYKLIRNITNIYDTVDNKQVLQTTEELYEINQNEGEPLIDKDPNPDLFGSTDPAVQSVRDDLKTKLDKLLASEPYCPGDGNRDGAVNAADVSNFSRIASKWGLSSVYDFIVSDELDGKTDGTDGTIIQNNLGKTCDQSYSIY